MMLRESFLKLADSKTLYNDSTYFAIHWSYFWKRNLIGEKIKKGKGEKTKKRG